MLCSGELVCGVSQHHLFLLLLWDFSIDFRPLASLSISPHSRFLHTTKKFFIPLMEDMLPYGQDTRFPALGFPELAKNFFLVTVLWDPRL